MLKNPGRNRATDRGKTSPRHLALVAMEALANYKASGLVHPADHMHEAMAMRLARIAARNSWE